MLFRLKTAGGYYKNHSIEKYKKYGFEFEYNEKYNEYRIINTPTIEINNIEEIMQMIDDLENEIIISGHCYEYGGEAISKIIKKPTITIYDGYLE